MFPTFSGSSRRPRNVNLSGQRTNPWANSGLSGASKTVANAQAEREKRQMERDELAAAKKIQRVWRGHCGRESAKAHHREQWDKLYRKDDASIASRDIVTKALSLLPALFDPSNVEDQRRLDQLVADLSADGPWDPNSGQWDKLVAVLVIALERRPKTSSQGLLSLLVDIVKRRPYSITPVSNKYYKLLSQYSEQTGKNGTLSLSPSEQQCLAEAISAPLSHTEDKAQSLQAYEAFAFTFLTAPHLLSLESNPVQVAGFLQLQTLSESIVNVFARRDRISQNSKDGLLWLLAHFIALNHALPTSQGSAYLEALYRQLSELAADIRMRSSPEEDDDDETSDDVDASVMRDTTSHLPPYVRDQLEFLVNEDGISELLSRFTSTAASPERLNQDASLLAGYTLILLRCFPSHGDDIKMRLFQGDIATGNSAMSSVKYFWRAMSRTEVFSFISQGKSQPRSSVVAMLRPDLTRDQEWRTVLLFLELYNFLLRVTDDEDFLQVGEGSIDHSPAVARIRSSGLSVDELKQLATFLKNLTFTLYYNLPDIMPSALQPPTLGSLMGVPDASKSATRGNLDKMPSPSFAGIIGIDVLTLRRAATTTMRSLYDRDSRRPFLPEDYWLMTSKFDMDGFIHAVVLEEQKKDEVEEEDEEMNDVGTGDIRFHTSAYGRLSHAAQVERQRQLRRVQREQLLAQVGPKLEILKNMPFTIPFEVRVQIFRQFVHLDKTKRRGGHVDPDRWRLSVLGGDGLGGGNFGRGREILGRHTARIKRGQVFLDAYDQFYSLGEALKEPIQITFIDQFDQQEAGIDGGGVTKEFLTSVTGEALNPDASGPGLFVSNSQNLLYPNPTAFDERAEMLRYCGVEEGSPEWASRLQELSRHYEFLGRIVGKCMYEGILIDIAFAGFFLLKWSSSSQKSTGDFRASLNDLRDLDAELYKGLINLKNYPGDVADLSLDFTISDQFTSSETGEVRTMTRALRKDGENIAVTNKDRPLYISYVAHHRLVAQPYRQTKAFLRGLGSIINPSWLCMFNQSELQRLVGGDSSEIDVEDLRRNTEYSGLYAIGDDGIEHPTVQMFWRVMHKLKDSERRDVLKYVTSTPRAPLLGFGQLSPHFSIRDGGDDQERLPSTSTCVNLLKLPRYNSAETLKRKLLYAIQSGAGFDLS